MSGDRSIRNLFLFRAEMDNALREELQDRSGVKLDMRSPGPGLLEVSSDQPLSVPECVFERQRMVDAGFVPAGDLKPVSDATVHDVLGRIIAERPLWTVHLLSADEPEDPEATITPSRRLEGIWNTIVRLGRKAAPDMEKRFRPPHRLKPGGLVLQLLMTRDGLWHALEPVEAMTNPRPGGFARMKWDPLAPSRSYLKIEEALDRMPVQPTPGERVIDLGAAPGGWTYAFQKRGCDVIAVDHGPMKLPEPQPGWGRVTHVRENGITFEAPKAWPRVDWLIGDMLIAPGIALGLLRRWIGSGKARCIICNIKLPQEHPYRAIRPIAELAARSSAYQTCLKQLYHDRREITVMAWPSDLTPPVTTGSARE